MQPFYRHTYRKNTFLPNDTKNKGQIKILSFIFCLEFNRLTVGQGATSRHASSGRKSEARRWQRSNKIEQIVAKILSGTATGQ